MNCSSVAESYDMSPIYNTYTQQYFNDTDDETIRGIKILYEDYKARFLKEIKNSYNTIEVSDRSYCINNDTEELQNI
jgi:hypothetical protein